MSYLYLLASYHCGIVGRHHAAAVSRAHHEEVMPRSSARLRNLRDGDVSCSLTPLGPSCSTLLTFIGHTELGTGTGTDTDSDSIRHTMQATTDSDSATFIPSGTHAHTTELARLH